MVTKNDRKTKDYVVLSFTYVTKEKFLKSMKGLQRNVFSKIGYLANISTDVYIWTDYGAGFMKLG